MLPVLKKIRKKILFEPRFDITISDLAHSRSTTRQKPNAIEISSIALSEDSGSKAVLQRCWWNPLWLHQATAGSFAVLVAALAAGIFALWYRNNRDRGFHLISDDHYLWTYGPTAILVLIVAAWRQLDYHCKSLLPWTVLQNGRTSAEGSILLDYVSTLQVVSFGKSLKLGHIPVIASISGFMLLKLITLASTGLLELTDVTITKGNIELERTSQLDGSLFNRTEYIAKTDSSLVYNAYGIAAFGLDSPDGLDAQGLVYETFQWPDAGNQANLSITAKVNAFIPQFKCEAAQVSINANASSTDGSQASVVIMSPSCELAGGTDPTFVLDETTLQSTVCPPIQRRGIMRTVNCSDDDPASASAQLLVLAEIGYRQEFEGSVNREDVGKGANVSSWSVGIKRLESVVCRPSYTMLAANATFDMSQSPPRAEVRFADFGSGKETHNLQELDNGSKLDDFSDYDLSLTFLAALLDAADLSGEVTANEFATDYPDTMFKMMVGSDSAGYASLFGADSTGRSNLARTAQDVFRTVTGQVVNKNLRRATNTSLSGEATYVETRLVVNNLVSWLIIGGSVIVGAIAVILLFVRPQNVASCPPESLTGLAEILSQSVDLEELVNKNPDQTEKGLEESLQLCDFATTSFMAYKYSAMHFSIDVFKSLPILQMTGMGTPKPGGTPKDTRTSQWWKPLMLRRSLTILTILLPLLAFTGLEIVHQISRRGDRGIPLSIGDGELSNANLFSRLIPALVMLLIATMFNAVDFNLAVLAPFTALKRNAVPASTDLGRSLVSQMPLVALWRALRMRWWPAGSSALAALIGSLLTIVVSGLYTIDPVPQTASLILEKLEILNTSLPDAKLEDGSASTLLSLLESANVSLPASTYKDLIFPMLGASYEDISKRFSSNATISAKIPALQASLECSTLTPQEVNTTSSFNARILTSSVSVSARANLPPTCPFGGPNGSLPSIEFTQLFQLPQNASYVGKLLDLHVGPYDDILSSSAGEVDPNQQPDNPPGCPSLAFVYGYADVNNPDATALTTLICSQHIRQVDTQTSMTPRQKILNSTILSAPNTPYLPGSLSDKTLTAFPFRIQLPLDTSLSLFSQSIFPSAANAQSPVDSFFQGVLFGKTPSYPDKYTALARTTAEDRKVVLDGIKRFYGRYMALAMSAGMRQKVTTASVDGGADAEDPGVAEDKRGWDVAVHGDSTGYILTQHRTSKIILQVMLLLMAGLMAFALLELERTGGLDVVRYNPCTIWGRMGLLAGSSLLDAGKEGVGMEGRMVKLGWKEDKNGERRWCVDLVDEKEEGGWGDSFVGRGEDGGRVSESYEGNGGMLTPGIGRAR